MNSDSPNFSGFGTLLALVAGSAGCGVESATEEANTASLKPPLSFFVTSETHTTGNLGGLAGADAICERLASAVGAGARTWHAYLSAENGGTPIHARDRIGAGPWYNALGAMVAQDVGALHAATVVGNADLFITEKGEKVAGQWPGSPSPVEHDILTGAATDGTLSPRDATGRSTTCNDWTSDGVDAVAQVGHSDGFGPAMRIDPPNLTSWNSAHANQDCSNTAPRGGAGRFYCFAAD